MKDCSWRHNKIMFLENFYPRAHTGTVITKLHNKKVIIPFPMPSYKCFPTYQDKYHGKKRTFFCLESGKCCLQGCSGQRLPPTVRQDCCSCIVSSECHMEAQGSPCNPTNGQLRACSPPWAPNQASRHDQS